MIDPVLKLTLHLEGPFVSQDRGASVFGTDTQTLKNNQGKIIVPGSQIKGLLREIFEAAICEGALGGKEGKWLKVWFGTGSGNIEETESHFEPKTGRLFVSDLVAKCPKNSHETITRIQVDSERGSVSEGMLQVIEAPFGYGEKIEFTGKIRIMGNVSQKELDSIRDHLICAFNFIPAVGAFKTAGFGRLKGCEIVELPSNQQQQSKVNSPVVEDFQKVGAQLILTPKEPFVVWSRSFGGNFFAGDSEIPGQVLKAIAARWLADRGILKDDNKDAFARLVFRHARPFPEDCHLQDASKIPLSIYRVFEVSNSKISPQLVHLGDCLHECSEFDVWSECGEIKFAPDWKPHAQDQTQELEKELAKTYPRCSRQPKGVTRTRTSIGLGGCAEDGQLFTYSAVDPQSFKWFSKVFIPNDICDNTRSQMAELLKALSGTSLGLGKTKAPLKWSSCPLKEGDVPQADQTGDVWRVILQTPACLHGPSGSYSTEENLDPKEALRKDYETYWEEVLGVKVKLKFMAQQRLAGGYLSRRYPIISESGLASYLLTKPGSIFVLEALDKNDREKIQKQLDKIAVMGLPLSDAWNGQCCWTSHPFLPTSGWGEVRIAKYPAETG